MEQYTSASRKAAHVIIGSYSTSFGIASRLFTRPLQGYIGDIYALVRIADEIVDTYEGPDAAELLNTLELDVYRALVTGYSTNVIVHAFATTARRYNIGRDIIEPFFASMRMDLQPPANYDDATYRQYIYGSAEVVGLMCLRVFVDDNQRYDKLSTGAKALGAAFQKVNFVRDLADDYTRLHRYYLPYGTFDSFDDATRDTALADIRRDLVTARQACRQLPASSQYAVGLALRYFETLTARLEQTPAAHIKQHRVRVSDSYKLWLYADLRVKRVLGVSAL